MRLVDVTFQETLAACEQVIERGLKNFVEVGSALLSIRDQRLYKETHKSFESYCRERWQMTKTNANRLVQGAEVAVNLTPMGVIPTSERVARPLTGLKPEQQVEAWSNAVEAAGGTPAAKDVEAAVADILATTKARNLEEGGSQKAKDPEKLDTINYPIPVKIQPLWARADSQASSAIGMLAGIRRQLRSAEANKDPIFAAVNINTINAELGNVLRSLKQAVVPHAVCTSCQGLTSEACTHCKHRGYLDRGSWEQVPTEIREMRERAGAR